MQIKNLKQFEDFLKTRIPTREALFMGDIGLQRAKYFMKLLGNPQNNIRVIHIAGTSGKGSTAYLTSHILQSQGFKVGLSISPHVFDIRERMQVFCSTIVSQTATTTNGGHTNEQVFHSVKALRTRTTKAGHTNGLLDEKTILKYFNQILPLIKKMEKTKYGMPTFFEINVGLAFFMFAKEKVDYAVMETGLGGTLDATNTISSKNKICIITKIGLDHTEILGRTVSEIAEQKAGIIQKQNSVISIKQTHSAQSVIRKTCEEKEADLLTIQKKSYGIISSTPRQTIFDFNFPNTLQHFKTTASKCCKMKKIKLGLIGKHQAENCSLALACLNVLSERDDFNINEKMLRSTLRNIRIPGRMEIRKIGPQTVIIDGAHNPQKMETFTSNLAIIYPDQKFTFLVAFKKSKDFKNMLKKIIPLSDKILLTNFSTSGMDNHWISTDNQTISKFLLSRNFQNFEIIENKHSDILKNIRMSEKPVVVTGSLYFIGSIYKFLK